jgi:hypothetical protein
MLSYLYNGSFLTSRRIHMADFINNISYDTTATIASGASTSAAVDLNGYTLVGLVMPSAFTGTTMTFTMSPNDGTYVSITNAGGTALSATVAASKCILFTPGDFVGVRFIKLVSGSSEGAGRTITLALRKLT